MTTLVTAASVTLGDLLYSEQASEVTVELGLLPAVSSAVVRFPSAVELSAQLGQDASVELDGGEGPATVLTGWVTGIRRSREASEVLLADAGAKLGGSRPATTFGPSMAADAIRTMASDAGVGTGVVLATMQLATYAAHQQRTAAEHIAHLAHLAGAVASVDGDGRLSVTAWPTGPAMTALRYDRDFVEYRTEQDLPPISAVVVGGGPAGAAAAPNALAQTLEALTGGAQDPGPDGHWLPQPVLRTPAAAEKATGAENAAAGATASRVAARCWLQPALRPGAVLEVQEVPAGVDGGPWLVTAVEHRSTPQGAASSVAGVKVGGADAGGLLAALAGAAGGLL